jgi:hypothetical protein
MTTKTLRAEAADRVGQLETALAKCRDAMPEQTDKAIDALLVESIASPDAVPAYVKAVAVQLEREKAEFQHAAGTMQIALDGLKRENAALEKRLQEIQRMCLGYQEEHARLRKDAEQNVLYGFFYTDCYHESGLVLQSLHRSKRNAFRAKQKAQWSAWEKCLDNGPPSRMRMGAWGKHDQSNTFEIYEVKPVEVLP